MRKKIILIAVFSVIIVLPIGLFFLNKSNPNLTSDPIDSEGSVLTYCVNLIENDIPLRDEQIFVDTGYPEVTAIQRSYWDKTKLPSQVVDLETKDYACYPLPIEFDKDSPTKIEWTCELEYEDYQYLKQDQTEKKAEAEEAGFNCQPKECRENKKDTSVWLCTK